MAVHKFEREPGVRTSRGAVIRHISAQITVNCTCGALEPLIVHFIPGVDLKARCQGCRTTYFLGKLDFDYQRDGNLQVGVVMIPPEIIVADANGGH